MRRAAAFACPLRVGSGVKNKILADEIRRSGSQRCEETAPTGRWKPAIETHGGRASAGHPGAEGDHHKKLKTQAKQTTATLMVARFGLGQRREKWPRKFEQAVRWRICYRSCPYRAMKGSRQWQKERDGRTPRCSKPKWRWPRWAATRRWPNWRSGLRCSPPDYGVETATQRASGRPIWRWNRFGGAAD